MVVGVRCAAAPRQDPGERAPGGGPVVVTCGLAIMPAAQLFRRGATLKLFLELSVLGGCSQGKSDLELRHSKRCRQFSWRHSGESLASRSHPTAFHPGRGKPAESRRRKARGLGAGTGLTAPPRGRQAAEGHGQAKSPSVPETLRGTTLRISLLIRGPVRR